MLSREIKFRGYSKEYGGWLFSHRLFTNTKEGENKGKTFLNVTEYIDDWEEVECLGEYTGFDDVKGKEIYEGDIVRCNAVSLMSEVPDGFIGQVEFVECGFYVTYGKQGFFLFDECHEWEVIGNTYENGDLLSNK